MSQGNNQLSKKALLARFFRLNSQSLDEPGKYDNDIREVKKQLADLGVTGSDEELLTEAKAVIA